jgi:hypothetical protein
MVALALRSLPLVLSLLACGDDRGTPLDPDAPVDGQGDADLDATPDASVDAGITCTTTMDCPLDTVCNASCVADTCIAEGDCPSNHGCPIAGPAAAPRHCGAACNDPADCRAGEQCKSFASGRFCARGGTRPTGNACTSVADCAGEAACLDWPGGYCAEAGCTDNTDCVAGTWCVDGLGVCAQGCVSDACREAEGYTCTLSPTLGGIERFVCVP